MIIVLVLALIVASIKLAGGSLSRVAQIRLRHTWAVVAALGVQILVISVLPQSLPENWARGLHVASYVFGVFWLLANRHIAWLWMVGLGGALNIIAISANGGIMPALHSALVAAGDAPAATDFTNSTTLAHPHLVFLGDVFAIPKGVPLANVFSIGDVLLVVGAALLMHNVCGSRLAVTPRSERRPPAALPLRPPRH